MKNQIQEIAFELDNTANFIEAAVETLSDIDTEFGHLREDMDNAVFRGDQQIYYREHHRQVRLLSHLMRHVLGELRGSSEKASELTQTLFKTVKEESEAASA
ncbi:hypothetical protein [Paenibacillus bouchesdurhonensis]|uniref:hypothetical protein n=1 Tax=Paenibacillus bouchesdurhonensis TaxID=1870990 RepID=UPI000DA5EED4|nr:hypothetical protein [Paenibacillus bouchesdurhonensis]